MTHVPPSGQVGASGGGLAGEQDQVVVFRSGDSPASGSGVIEEVTTLTGNALPASGFFVVAEGTFSLGVADLTVTLTDNVTHLLVTGFRREPEDCDRLHCFIYATFS